MLFRDRRHLLTKGCRVIACDGNATNVYDRNGGSTNPLRGRAVRGRGEVRSRAFRVG